MKKFLRLSILLCSSIIFVILIIFSLVDGYNDVYYLKIASPKQSSLILGDSRAAQGIVPHIMNDILDRNDIFNFAFSNLQSPYGEIYFESIKNKLDHSSNEGIFIIAVSPMNISSRYEVPRDENSFLKDVPVDKSLNLAYLLKYYKKKYYHIFLKDKHLFLQNDGHVNVTISMDSLIVNKRTENMIKSQSKNMGQWKFSQERLGFLSNTIAHLKNHGEVYLIRMPSNEELFFIENAVVPDFDMKMKKLSTLHNIDYISFVNKSKEFIYTDGFHLHKDSAIKFSKILSKKIKTNDNN
tara:strand:- start:564 stop:1451 length:888 start_codon:yes stop_codon:yes gene_type:complete